MFVVRPAERRDLAALQALVQTATQGVHTLPRSPEAMERAIEESLAAFAAEVDMPGEEAYLFVLEHGGAEDADGKLDIAQESVIAGLAAIHATAGAAGTFFAFRNDVIQQVSRDLNISHSVHALTLCSDLSGCSQLSGFYVNHLVQDCVQGAANAAANDAVHATANASATDAADEVGKLAAAAELLSRARLLFAALSPRRFSDKFFASLAGVSDAEGRSPFWEALGRKFFQMDFLQAERVVEGARNRTLIVELMPHFPVYVPLLPSEAQAAMGQVHPQGELPFTLLTREGFFADDYIDIFDGGPILQAHKTAIRTIATAVRRRVIAGEPDGADDADGADAAADIDPTRPSVTCLVGNTSETRFRAVMVACQLNDQANALVPSLTLTPQACRALGVADGDHVICVRM